MIMAHRDFCSSGTLALMRIYISSTDKFRHRPLYEVIVYAAKRYGLSGATVLRGVMGYGGSSAVGGTNRLWEISEKVPMVIEIIDQEQTLLRFLEQIKPYFARISKGFLVTLDRTSVVLSRPESGGPTE